MKYRSLLNSVTCEHASKYETKFYYIGFVTGFILSVILFLGIYAFKYTDPMNLNTLVVSETNNILLKYIEGKWVSAVEDVFVTLDIHDSNEIIILENINNVITEKRFLIKGIKKVDGALGIIVLELCDQDNTVDTIIQINKVFGVNNTITVLYDSSVASCKNVNEQCIRAFKRNRRI